jgi:MFS transporter, DHA1 family, multidrug resistance protein
MLPYEKDRDPSPWKRYVDTGKSGHMASHGHTGGEEKSGEARSGQD